MNFGTSSYINNILVQNDLDPDLKLFNIMYPETNTGYRSNYHDSNSINHTFSKLNNDFGLIHLNIRSLYNKLDDFISMVSTLNFIFDVYCFSESWLDENSKDLVSIPGYLAYHSLRPLGKRGGGVTIFVKDAYNVEMLDSFTINCEIFESLFLKLERGGKKVIVGIIYKPPHINKDIFIEKMSYICHDLGNFRIPILLCGDFNIDFLNSDSVPFRNMLSSYFLIPLISKPTRITDTSLSLIVNIFVNLPNTCHSGIICCDLSDHFPIFMICKSLFEEAFIDEKVVKYRLVNDGTLSQMCTALEKTNFDFCDYLVDIDVTFDRFYNLIFSAYADSCPIRVKKISNKRLLKPWIDHEILMDIKLRQKYFIQYKQGLISKQFFTRFRNSITNRIRVAKATYYDKKFSEYRNNAKKSWSLINDLIRPHKSDNMINKIRFNNRTILDYGEMAEVFNNYFCRVGVDIANSINSNGEHLSFMSGNFGSSFFMNPTNPQEIFSLVSKLKPKANDNVNFIPVRVLKAINYIICHPLSKIINGSFSVGTFPKKLKVAKVIPIPKQGDSSLVENYRPISLLNIFSKIFEKIAYNRLYSYLEHKDILYKRQFGFRKGKSTADALVTNLIDFYKKLDGSNVIFSMFLDFRKAFDCVDPQILISKLKFYGVRGIASKWFESFLSERLQFTMVNGVKSREGLVSHGVPQGSTLGPLLFLVFINDLPNVSNLFNFTLFADDCTLTTAFKNTPSTYSQQANIINAELELLGKWFQENRISVNYNKTKFIIFTYGKYIHFPNIHNNNHIIHQTEFIKFLGVIFDYNLKFREHLKYISDKISKWIGILYKLRYFLPSQILLKIYKSFVHPYILYGLEIWYSSFQYVGDRILVLQKKVMRCIYKLPFNDHTSQYFKISRVLKVSDLFKYNLVIILFKMFNYNMYPSLRSSLTQHADIHSHFTRGRQNFIIPRFRKARFSKSIVVLGTKFLNEFSSTIFESDSLQMCKRMLNQSFFENY